MHTPQPDSSPASRSFSRQVRPAVGETLAERYRLERESAHTEAGLVFDATDTRSGRRVAIELASSLEDPKARRKWARDAMMAQRLEGEHVLRVLEVGNTQNNVPFVVREAAVSTLAAEIDARGSLPVEQAVGWTLEACEAVAEAHAVGMAHGDLRLDNVYLARGTDQPTVKVAWTSAAKAERAAKEDVQRDIASLGAMLRVLAVGRRDVEADGAATLPSDVAHAVSRALSQSPEGAFHNVSELARELAPYAPPGHGSARNVAFLMSRSGIVGGPIPGSGPASGPRSSRRSAALAPVGPTAQAGARAGADRASFTDEWFGRGARASHAALGVATPAPTRTRGVAFTVVSMLLVGAVLGGTWLLFSSGKLPRWTGAAPPEEVGTTQVTSAPDENAQAAALAAAEAQQRAAANDQAEAETKARAEAEQQQKAEAARAKATAATKAPPIDAVPSAPRADLRTTTPAEPETTATGATSSTASTSAEGAGTTTAPTETGSTNTTPAVAVPTVPVPAVPVPAVPVPAVPVPTVAPTSAPAPGTASDPSSTPF